MSKDGRLLIFEYLVENEYVKGIHVEYEDILEISDTSFKIRLDNTSFYTGYEKPYRYYLNIIQDFEKQNTP